MANFIGSLISLSIGAVVLASVFIFTVKNQTLCGSGFNVSDGTCAVPWSASEIALWGLISLVGIAGMIYGVMGVFGLG